MSLGKQSNKVIARRKQHQCFVEGKLWSVRLIEALIGTVSDPKLIRAELSRMESMLDSELRELQEQIKGGEQRDERTTNVREPIDVYTGSEQERGTYIPLTNLPRKVD